MYYTHQTLRKAFSDFWESHGHKLATPAPLVLTNDPTTLFNSSGMQQLIPNLQGEPHPQGMKLYNIQPCFRAVDIDEVGDNRHTTFFEMMGNWSLGDYFKKEQLTWFWEFLTEVLKLPKEKLYVTVFEGDKDVPKDTESYDIWKSLGVPEDHIHFYGVDKNWWSRSGTPERMPAGEIGGPDSEVFYEFTDVQHDKIFGEECHPNCDCGRFLEIGNSVFIQYRKKEDGTLEELPQKNVDFGGGLERILAALNNNPDIFRIDIFNKVYENFKNEIGEIDNSSLHRIRIFLDHSRATIFIANEGIIPGKNEHNYILRKLIRRADDNLNILFKGNRQLINLHWKLTLEYFQHIYQQTYEISFSIIDVIFSEINKYQNVARYIPEYRLKIKQDLDSSENINAGTITASGTTTFYTQTYGIPPETAQEIAFDAGVNKDLYIQDQLEKSKLHKEISRAGSTKRFAGGLADHSEQVIKYHTATHLIHQALFDVLGNDIRQEGSNITGERLRFDFSTSRKATQEEIKKVQEIAQSKIDEGLPMTYVMLPREEAFKIGARSFFKEKYPEQVKVYYIGTDLNTAYSKEFCGGPHVKNTSEIGHIDIYKFEKIGSNLYRIYAK